jgi:hypothetical protein
MAICNVTQFSGASVSTGVVVQAPLCPALLSENVTASGTSAQSAVFSGNCSLVRIICDAACYIKFGANPTAAAGDIYLAAGAVEYFAVSGSGQRLAVVTA